MPESIDDVHRDVARIVLRAIGEHQAGSRFGLVGGNALSAHGLLNRPTEDVDIALGTLDRFTEAADAAGEALVDSGYTVHLVDKRSGWEDDDDEVGLAEMVAVTADGKRQIQVQIGYFDLLASPVTVAGLGPVCGLDDVAGHKTVALANRMLTRDYVDVAAPHEGGVQPPLAARSSFMTSSCGRAPGRPLATQSRCWARISSSSSSSAASSAARSAPGEACSLSARSTRSSSRGTMTPGAPSRSTIS